ncbi:MAG TPA: UrcA family protein [Povalibacter sp.]|uniref:UrcA family protein n=1 Tax=Povalibacter sp. TaxID=1962978 RepID=UPI002BAC74C1|nr:UrcA family protein [Povalibacter sp.]HMN46277.1 UrcA family protein [Povalibacter sp.]
MNARSLSLKHSLRVALLAAVSCVASVAAADDVAASRSITVSYRDLDLSSEAGARQLYDRIRAAARNMCGSPRGTALLQIKQQRRQCANAAVAAAVKQVDNGILTAMHRGKSTRRLG